MATTVIFAEILIIGLQSTIWVVLTLTYFLDFHLIDLRIFKGWEGLFTVFIFAIAYTLGIIVDRIADSCFSHFTKTLRKKYIPEGLPFVPEMRLKVMLKNDNVAKFLDYIRSKMRIARSTSINLLLITIISCFILVKYTPLNSLTFFKFILPISGIGIVATIISIFTWARITQNYYQRLVQTYKVISKS